MSENGQNNTGSSPIATEDIKKLRSMKRKRLVQQHKKKTGSKGKDGWDKANIIGTLTIPLVVLVATIGFGWWQGHLADIQHQQDQASALDQQEAVILQTYIDNIQDLLVNHHLQQSSLSDSTNPYYDIAILAQARTLTALQGLDQDPKRKAYLLVFLYDAKLIGFTDNNGQVHSSIIALIGADLRDADLRGANLGTIDLSFADLSGADFNGANLSGASFYHTNLSGAVLTHTILKIADFSGAVLSHTDLRNVLNLTQQQLDEVYSCEGAILPQGLECHKQ